LSRLKRPWEIFIPKAFGIHYLFFAYHIHITVQTSPFPGHHLETAVNPAIFPAHHPQNHRKSCDFPASARNLAPIGVNGVFLAFPGFPETA